MALARGRRPAAARLLALCVGASVLPSLAQRGPRSARSDRRLDDKEFPPAVATWEDDAKFTPTGRKHLWCDQDKRLVESFGTVNKTNTTQPTMSFRHGLENRTISVVFLGNDLYVKYDQETHTITGGFFPEILDEAAARAGFHWRNSFTVVSPPDGSKDETYDEWLAWAVYNYDLVVGDFSATEERTASGYRFAFPILDESPVLVSVFKDEDPPFYETAFAFHRPFTMKLWLTIMLVVVLTAFLYLSVESEYPDFEAMKEGESYERSCGVQVDSVGHALWLTTVSFTGGGSLLPHTALGKTVSLTWTFLVLLFTAAYTANLASQLVVKTVASAPITGIEDAIQRNVPVCVYKGGAFDKMIHTRYPDLALKYPKVWGYDNVRTGNCGAIVKDRFDFDIDIGRKSANPKCDLNIVGQPIVIVGGGFVTNHDSSKWCSSMVIDILSVALHDMYNDGWLAEAKVRFVGKIHDQSCSTGGSTKSRTAALTVVHFAGIFLIHIAVSALSLLVYCTRRTPVKKSRRHLTSGSYTAALSEPMSASLSQT